MPVTASRNGSRSRLSSTVSSVAVTVAVRGALRPPSARTGSQRTGRRPWHHRRHTPRRSPRWRRPSRRSAIRPGRVGCGAAPDARTQPAAMLPSRRGTSGPPHAWALSDTAAVIAPSATRAAEVVEAGTVCQHENPAGRSAGHQFMRAPCISSISQRTAGLLLHALRTNSSERSCDQRHLLVEDAGLRQFRAVWRRPGRSWVSAPTSADLLTFRPNTSIPNFGNS